ncbi:hypothetical protein ACKWLJ_004808, partial [Escherichia coli]
LDTLYHRYCLYCWYQHTYTFGEPDIHYYNPALYSSIINPDEVPELMRNFSKLEIYRLMHDDNCAGLIIADPDTYVYQRLNDIVCGQAKVMSGNIH